MNAEPSDPTRWLTDLLATQQAILMAWLNQRAGAMADAPVAPGNRQFSAIEPAPGRYIKDKAPA